MTAEYIAFAPQTVATGSNVIWENTICDPHSCAIIHRDESGIFTIKGKGKYKVYFGANISVGTAAGIGLLSFAVDGEALPYTTMANVSVTAGSIGNVARAIYIDVPCYCCAKLSIRNVGAEAVTVENANLIIERVV